NGDGSAAPSPPSTVDSPQGEGTIVDVEFPQMGDSVAEGTVLEWLKQVGDPVAVEEELVEISTDKVDAAVPSPVAGTLTEILVQADETVPTGTVLCRIAAGPPSTVDRPQASPPAAAPAPDTPRPTPTNGA